MLGAPAFPFYEILQFSSPLPLLDDTFGCEDVAGDGLHTFGSHSESKMRWEVVEGGRGRGAEELRGEEGAASLVHAEKAKERWLASVGGAVCLGCVEKGKRVRRSEGGRPWDCVLGGPVPTPLCCGLFYSACQYDPVSSRQPRRGSAFPLPPSIALARADLASSIHATYSLASPLPKHYLTQPAISHAPSVVASSLSGIHSG